MQFCQVTYGLPCILNHLTVFEDSVFSLLLHPALILCMTCVQTELLRQVLSNTDLNLASELHLLLEHTNGTLGELRTLIMGENILFNWFKKNLPSPCSTDFNVYSSNHYVTYFYGLFGQHCFDSSYV